MKKIILISLLVIIITTVVGCVFLKFDNTTDKVVSEDKTKVVILVDESYVNNVVKAKLVIENHNGFDINMFSIYCLDDNINFDISNEGAFTIENDDIFNYDFIITFDEKMDGEDYLSFLENKNIMISFNANNANQNSNVTQIKAEVKSLNIDTKHSSN